MLPREWIRLLLERHALQGPDGRALYRYRVTDQEYKELVSSLSASSLLGVEHVSQTLHWDAAFVIYASEWWRRHYDGHWGWQGILESIGISYETLNVGLRNEIVENGLRRWKREVRSYQGKRHFLGTVATEGGLPLHQMADSGGWLKSLLRVVLTTHVSRAIPLSVLIENHSNSIPQSYRASGLFQVLEDLADSVVMLRNEYDLTSKPDPVDWLDINVTGWRDYFPFSINDAMGMSLLKDLVDTVSRAKEDVNLNPFIIERSISGFELGIPTLFAHLDIPSFVYLESFDFDSVNLPALAIFEICGREGKRWPICKGIQTTYRGKKAFKLTGKSFKLEGDDAKQGLILQIKNGSQVLLELELQGGNMLDDDLPWLFRDVGGKFSLHGMASQSIKDSIALAYLPGSAMFKLSDKAEQHGETLGFNDGSLVMFSGEINCSIGDERFTLSAGEKESVNEYIVIGKRFEYRSLPVDTFIGPPRVITVNKVTGSKSVSTSSNLQGRAIGLGGMWKPLNSCGVGTYEIRILDNRGLTVFRKRVGILPSDFKIKLLPSRERIAKGVIELSNLGRASVIVNSPGVSSEIVNDTRGTRLQLNAGNFPPIHVEVNLLFPASYRENTLFLPFPSRGVVLFNADDAPVSLDKPVYLDKLMGMRLKIYRGALPTRHTAKVTFRLDDPSIPGHISRDVYKEINLDIESDVAEFVLQDWAEIFESILAVSSSLDSVVNLTIKLSLGDLYQLNVRQYESVLNPLFEHELVEIDGLDFIHTSVEKIKGIQIIPMLLGDPEQNLEQLIPENSQGVLTGRWPLGTLTRKNSPILLYPSKNSEVNFRPLLWYKHNSSEPDFLNLDNVKSLRQAILLHNDIRQAAISHILTQLATDFDHSDWNLINLLWEKTSHLPLETLDIWINSVNVPSFLVALFLKDKMDLLEKLESQLPLVWELISLNEWEAAINAFKKKLEISLNGEVDLIKDLLQSKIEKIATVLGLVSTSAILMARTFSVKSDDLVNLRQFDANMFKQLVVEPKFQDLLVQGQVDSY